MKMVFRRMVIIVSCLSFNPRSIPRSVSNVSILLQNPPPPAARTIPDRIAGTGQKPPRHKRSRRWWRCGQTYASSTASGCTQSSVPQKEYWGNSGKWKWSWWRRTRADTAPGNRLPGKQLLHILCGTGWSQYLWSSLFLCVLSENGETHYCELTGTGCK